MNNYLFWILLAMGMTGPAGAVKQMAVVRYSQKEGLKDILSNSRLDVLKIKPGYGVECLADDSELAALKNRGFAIDVIIDDVIAYNRKIKANYKSDSFGPYYSYAEAVTEMNNLHSDYPALVSVPEALGASWEDRPIWGFKVSISPTSDNGKPGVLYTGVHHAREPIGVTINLGFARYLCRNYNSDPSIKTLVDNRQMWFIPVVNPDGYVYNQTFVDSLWRKNRRNNGTSYGVDLNRNYPYGWGYDDFGSSPTPSNETYRGPSAGSEPEVQAVMSLMSREGYFKTALNYHAYGNYLVYPWGYIADPVPDSGVYRDLGYEIAGLNWFFFGTGTETVGYTTNGDSDDWMYGDEFEKQKCFAFTPEVGEWFWQADSSIIVQQFNDNLMTNILTAQAAGRYLAATGLTAISGGNGDTIAEVGETVDMLVQLKNRAMEQTAISVAAYIKSDDPYINIKQAAAGYGDFLARQSKNNTAAPYQFEIEAGCPPGHQALLNTGITCNTGEVFNDSFQLAVGQQVRIDTIFADSVENGGGAWTHGGTGDLWHITAYSSHTSSHSWYCGNEGSWVYNIDMNCRLASGPIYSKRFKSLELWTKYDLETDYDYGYVEISADGGETWKKLGASYNGTAAWSKKVFDLSSYSGTVQLGFRLYSDMGWTEEGWYLDDILVTGDSTSNQPPSRPAPVSPAGGVAVQDSLPMLLVANAADIEGASLIYGFKIYTDSLLTNIYDQAQNITQGSSNTGWVVTKALIPGQYWWRAYADDGQERGLFSNKANFYYDPDGVQGNPDVRPLPGTYLMEQAFPNPSPGRMAIKYQLPRSGTVDLKIYNVSGQLVRALETGAKPAGYHAVRWDGRDDKGRNVSSGIYFCKLQVAGFSATQRLTVIR